MASFSPVLKDLRYEQCCIVTECTLSFVCLYLPSVIVPHTSPSSSPFPHPTYQQGIRAMATISSAKVLMARQVATNAVLATTELLEIILIYLPTKDLLLATRVCKHWRLCISTVPRMQTALFMRPEPITTCFKVETDIWSISERPHKALSTWSDNSDYEPFVVVIANPLLINLADLSWTLNKRVVDRVPESLNPGARTRKFYWLLDCLSLLARHVSHTTAGAKAVHQNLRRCLWSRSQRPYRTYRRHHDGACHRYRS